MSKVLFEQVHLSEGVINVILFSKPFIVWEDYSVHLQSPYTCLEHPFEWSQQVKIKTLISILGSEF